MGNLLKLNADEVAISDSTIYIGNAQEKYFPDNCWTSIELKNTYFRGAEDNIVESKNSKMVF